LEEALKLKDDEHEARVNNWPQLVKMALLLF
jgi:hypothetical protein